ncbi:hypothetical protein VULLAG_LOCUS426 [Vulpes lagopus]
MQSIPQFQGLRLISLNSWAVYSLKVTSSSTLWLPYFVGLKVSGCASAPGWGWGEHRDSGGRSGSFPGSPGLPPPRKHHSHGAACAISRLTQTPPREFAVRPPPSFTWCPSFRSAVTGLLPLRGKANSSRLIMQNRAGVSFVPSAPSQPRVLTYSPRPLSYFLRIVPALKIKYRGLKFLAF